MYCYTNYLSLQLHSMYVLVSFLLFMSNQKEQLKTLLSAREREEGARGPETVKVQLRSTLVSDVTHV